MIDLRNLNGGAKLIKEIIRTSKTADQPWTIENQKAQLNNQKNIFTQNTNLRKK